MSRSKHSAEERAGIIELYVSGAISQSEAARRAKVNHATIEDWANQYSVEGISAFLPKEHNNRYSPELKEAAVKAYLAGEGSLRGICKKYRIRRKAQLQNWIKVYNGHKDFKKQTGGSRMTKARKTTKEERIAIARECIASGRNYGEIAIKYNVSYQQVYNWTNKYAGLGDSGLEDRRGQRTAQQEPRTPEEELRIRIAQLEHELYMKEMECNLLKKLDEIERRRG